MNVFFEHYVLMLDLVMLDITCQIFYQHNGEIISTDIVDLCMSIPLFSI